MLLAGTDEIGYVVEKLPEIEAWEAAHPARVDTRIGTPPASGRGGASRSRTVHPIGGVSDAS
jgi:hypothetical protein